jgi:hypothetical protein
MDEIGQLLCQIRKSYDASGNDEVSWRLKAYYYTFKFNSPYAEVRAAVPNTDDRSIPTETFRAYFMGIVFGATCSAMNQVQLNSSRDAYLPSFSP